MINSIMKKVFGTRNDRELKRINLIVEQINALEEQISSLSDEDLKGKTEEFKARLKEGEALDDLLPEAFAVVREAAVRTLQMRHFDCQLIGGVVLHEGKIAEMKTGEGKTLVATLPVYLNALTGDGVHVVTVNDYLARRDAEWMGEVYAFLGISTGVVVPGLSDSERRTAYASDVVYGTNNEFGFDHLRDNMKYRLEDYVQRGYCFAIVDEVDSILVDEARTPLIISGPSEDSTDKYYIINKVIPYLKRSETEEGGDGDFNVDEKDKAVTLTEQGVEKVERLLKIQNLYDPKNIEVLHHVNQALKAHNLFKRDVDYVVKDGEVMIVDEFTGRLMAGRRWSDGLHQAVEAKEGVNIASENQTLASVTFQNYFRMYKKLSGMTGTADTEATEFQETYGLEVVVIPTNKPMARKDYPDVVYRSKREKYNAVIEEIKELHEKGQPVLVGTISIEDSERISHMLKKQKVKHHVLNAKYHEQEAEIVAQAGRKGSITISTNMAGRGTDIMLGGNPVFMAKSEVDPAAEPEKYKEGLEKYRKQCALEHEEVLAAGGLHILGTERHESRRIDNQLRGRSGRQGDPGSSRFYLSLEDDLMRIFGSERIGGLLTKLGLQEGEDIQHPWISKAIENAQKKVEGHNYDIRKHLLEYDDVMNRQREAIYTWRREVLGSDDLAPHVRELAEAVAGDIFDARCPKGEESKWDIPGLKEAIYNQFFFTIEEDDSELLALKETLDSEIIKRVLDRYEEKLAEFGPHANQLHRYVLINNIDSSWKDHLLGMDHLKSGIGLRGYAQENPLTVYKREGYDMFIDMRQRVEETALSQIFRIQIEEESAVAEEIKQEAADIPSSEPSTPVGPRASAVRGIPKAPGGIQKAPPVKGSAPKVGRNDPCPCGSGKKYKKCCGRNKGV
ncbi:MAG: preprotein translocase subunit SecA [Deltaproteobacteria bacterium]|nr:MAG: preprotein translocase subunit SecA [Deltaproteobacteria bacterium]